jgi:hypothetical protein
VIIAPVPSYFQKVNRTRINKLKLMMFGDYLVDLKAISLKSWNRGYAN